MLELSELFAKFEAESGNFKKVTGKLSKRPDVHAFMLLDDLCPSSEDMVSCAEHDTIWLSIDVDKLAKVCTEEDILELVRCGVIYDEETDSLRMFT